MDLIIIVLTVNGGPPAAGADLLVDTYLFFLPLIQQARPPLAFQPTASRLGGMLTVGTYLR